MDIKKIMIGSNDENVYKITKAYQLFKTLKDHNKEIISDKVIINLVFFFFSVALENDDIIKEYVVSALEKCQELFNNSNNKKNMN